MAHYKQALIATLLCASWLYIDGAGAQPGAVTRELDGMKRRMEPDPLKPKPGSSSGVQVDMGRADAWSDLKTQMTEAQVTGLLGKPDRVETQPQATRWYWEKSSPKGWVSFTKDSRRVIEWRNF